MDPARFHPVFLFLACFKAVMLAAHVEPPTNVTLHCHNMNNTVEWSYSQFPQGLKFKVYIGMLSGPSKELLVEPPALQADVSFLSDPDNDYYLTVRALIGQNESEEAPPDGITFSYYKDSQAKQKCFVDFPSVNVSTNKDGYVLFHFKHPWLLYNHNSPARLNSKPRIKKSHDAQMTTLLPEFKYDVVIINQKKPPQSFSCKENECDGKLVADPAQEKLCLSVTGEMQKMSVRATQEYCALPLENTPHEPNMEPPTNVTLHCHNMNNTVEWSYSQFPQGLKFKVYIGMLSGPSKELLVEPPALQADVSFFSDPDNDYYLTVRALIGQSESEEAPPDGITFSYYKDSQAKQKCFVDFPSVNVTTNKDGYVLFHFKHPWLLYNHNSPARLNSKPRKKSHDAQMTTLLPEFKYDVVIINQKKPPQSFSCKENECDGKLVADPAQEKLCLSVTGEMQKMSVQATQEYCALPLENTPHEPNKSMYVSIVVVSLSAFGVVAFVLFIVYKKRTTPSTSFPNSMTFPSRLMQWTSGTVRDTIFVPEVSPTSPTPLLSPTEEKESNGFPPVLLSSTETDVSLHIGVSTQDEGVFDVEENDETPMHTRGSSLDRDEPQILSDVSSGYETRPVLATLAPDEEAEGYRA